MLHGGCDRPQAVLHRGEPSRSVLHRGPLASDEEAVALKIGGLAFEPWRIRRVDHHTGKVAFVILDADRVAVHVARSAVVVGHLPVVVKFED
jgi:hypothetical protein